MSINPPSDIVLGVARAADPGAYRAAAEKLERIGTAASSVTSEPIPQSANAAKLSAQADGKGLNSTAGTRPAGLRSTPQTPADKAKAYEQFEGFLLQTFVEAMLPKDAPNVFGSGPAGDIWKSMMAQYLAEEMAESTKFGVAQSIAEHRQKFDKEKKQGLSAPAATPTKLNNFTEQLPYLNAILTRKANPTTDSSGNIVNDVKGS